MTRFSCSPTQRSRFAEETRNEPKLSVSEPHRRYPATLPPAAIWLRPLLLTSETRRRKRLDSVDWLWTALLASSGRSTPSGLPFAPRFRVRFRKLFDFS